MKIKVCGMRDAENIKAIAALQPDYMGFICYDQSPRYIGDDFKMPEISQEIKRIAVHVNDDFEKITNCKLPIANFQLHGEESPVLCDQLRKKETFTLIKAFQVDDDFDFKQLKKYKDVVDYFLFDTKSEGYGGSGKSFNREILKKYDNEIPLILSGGIGPDNIKPLIEFIQENKLNVEALDMNSRFEVLPGMKDVQKVKTAIKLIKSLT